MTETPLSRYASSLSLLAPETFSMRRTGSDFHGVYPMYTVPMETFLCIREVKTHEWMLARGELVQYEESLGRAMFVSHQWLGNKHPDPNGQQLKVLQDAMRNIMSGTSQVCLPIVSEMFYGRLACPTAAEFNSQPLFVWYDFLCCPQDSSEQATVNRQIAIYGIPSYVARCTYFIVLCPVLQHIDTKQILSQWTWAERGWCRTERIAQELAARSDSFIILVESAMHQTLIVSVHRFLEAPGEGKFTVEDDKENVGNVIVQMVWNKLHYFLEKGDLHNYRFLLNQQMVRCFQKLEVDPIDGLVPGLRTDSDPFLDPKNFVLDRFLHQNGFSSWRDRDTEGWSPLCFAVMRGDTDLVEALLDKKASPNDATAKRKEEMIFPKKLSVLSIAGYFHSNKVLDMLLGARANVNALDNHRGIALHWASVSNNAEGVRMLCEARSDVNQKCIPGLTSFALAVANSSVEAMEEMLAQSPETSLRYSFHFAMMFSGGCARNVSFLVRARADVNERFEIDTKQTAFWLILNLSSLKHRLSPSRWTSLAYHHHGATPLMFSILSGCFEATSILIAAGAQLHIQNFRRKTAADFARQMQAPRHLTRALEGQLADDAELDEDATFSI